MKTFTVYTEGEDAIEFEAERAEHITNNGMLISVKFIDKFDKPIAEFLVGRLIGWTVE